MNKKCFFNKEAAQADGRENRSLQKANEEADIKLCVDASGD